MNLQENRIDALDYPISALENQPALSAEELKAYFDGSAEQLMQAHNGMIDALGDRSAAAMVGFAPSNLIPENNVQDAVEYVRNHIPTVEGAHEPFHAYGGISRVDGDK